jgi:hypothetical protein
MMSASTQICLRVCAFVCVLSFADTAACLARHSEVNEAFRIQTRKPPPSPFK